MSEPFLAEIRIVAFNFAPRGWAFCDGQILPINQNQSLYSLLGTTYGGDGETSFALPDMRGRSPTHVGEGITQGERGGEEAHTLSASEMPQHRHVAQAREVPATDRDPASRLLARSLNLYQDATELTELRVGTVLNVGGGQPHENMQPYLAMNYVVALSGLFPSES